jgi:hypothetical protein
MEEKITMTEAEQIHLDYVARKNFNINRQSCTYKITCKCLGYVFVIWRKQHESVGLRDD